MRDQTFRERAERGQAMILIALAFVGLAAFIGLAVDTGILFSNVGHLRRATDAAALTAANQFRDGSFPDALSKEAVEMLKLNGIPDPDAQAWVCDLSDLSMDPPPYAIPDSDGFSYHDDALCPGGTYPPSGSDAARKVVRVEAEMTVEFAFLPIIGFGSTIIRANAESEAASIDLVLVLDVSESMALDLCDDDKDNDGDGLIDADDCKGTLLDFSETGKFEDDIEACRDATVSSHYPYPLGDFDIEAVFPDECHPFESVRHAAHRLVDRLYFPYDRIAIVTFGQLAKQWLPLEDSDNLPAVCTKFVDPDKEKKCAHAVLDQWVLGDDAKKFGVELPPPTTDPSDPYNCEVITPRGCLTTNIGDGLMTAGGMFCPDDNGNDECDRDEMREEALWFVILLTDGAANAGTRLKKTLTTHDDWICPSDTYDDTPPEEPFCRDTDPGDPVGRHADKVPAGPAQPYDADDYARDAADFVGCPGPNVDPPDGCPSNGGVGAVIFTIGLGDNVIKNPGDPTVPRAGEFLLRYIAGVDEFGATSDPECNDKKPSIGVSCGRYFFVEKADDLIDVFEDIASRIYTVISH